MGSSGLISYFQGYSTWRAAVAARVEALRRWLEASDLADAEVRSRLAQLAERLADDKFTVAFVAEFSRGKSELINSIFFADYGRRLLPSSAGRTTMCPTELAWDPTLPPSIRLLPIETRARHATTSELKRYPEEWIAMSLDVESGDALATAFDRVRETRRVPLEEAKHYGLFLGRAALPGQVIDGMVEIPRWRHAMINFPHPLLEQGLVILDTPGLNAIGTEPELTLSMLPNAHAVLFILALDTGVTQTDLDVWRNYIRAPGRSAGRLVVLNKIDSLWDGLRDESDLDAEIRRQVDYCAAMLDLGHDAIFAVSAQKGLVAKVTHDPALLERSRIGQLERALCAELIPARQGIVRDGTRADLDELTAYVRAILEARLDSVRSQLAELRGLRGKNLGVVEHLMTRVRREKEDFERGLGRFQALRGVFSQHSNRLFSHLGMDALSAESRQTLFEIRRSRFTAGVRAGMGRYFQRINGQLAEADAVVAEIRAMMGAMYERFTSEHGLRLGDPPAFSLSRYEKEVARLEGTFRTQFDTLLNMLTHEKLSLTQKFFETLAAEVARVYRYANREADRWLKAVISPMEAQVREHQAMLRRRVESIRRIHDAIDTLESRIDELQSLETTLARQLGDLARIEREAIRALARQEGPFAAAA